MCYKEKHPNMLDSFLLAYPLYVLVVIVVKYLNYMELQKEREKKEPMFYLQDS